MGRQLMEQKVSAPDDVEIRMDHLPASIYVLQVRDAQGNQIETHSISKLR